MTTRSRTKASRRAKGQDDGSKDATSQEESRALSRFRQASDLAARLSELDADALSDVILGVLQERRHAAAPFGIERAASIAIAGMLGIELNDDAAPKVARLAAVARGVHLQSTAETEAPLFRELASYVDHVATYRLTPRGRARRLASMLGEWRQPDAKRRVPVLSEHALQVALSKPSRAGRVTSVAFAVGLVTGDATIDPEWRAVYDRVRKALKKP